MNNALRLGLMAAAVAALLATMVWLVAFGGVAASNGEQQLKVADLDRRCATAPKDDDGFGQVSVDRRLIVNGRGEVTVPCQLTLKRGGGVTFAGARLRTKHLTIVDEASNGKTQVKVNGSDLLAAGEHGLFVQLHDSEDRISVHGSTIDYPVNVWGRIVDHSPADTGGGRVDASGSTIRSTRVKEGYVNVQFVAGEQTGTATFEDVVFDAPKDPDTKTSYVLISAGDCEQVRVQNGPRTCDPEGHARMKAEMGDPVIVDGKPWVPTADGS